MTSRQLKEIECLDYFALNIDCYKGVVAETLNFSAKIIEYKRGASPEEAYFFITDSGRKEIATTNKQRLYQLLDAKKWRLRMMDEYEQGLLDGVTPYYCLLGLEQEVFTWYEKLWYKLRRKRNDTIIPKVVMEFMATTMFKGIDKETIINLWNENNENKNNQFILRRREKFRILVQRFNRKRV